MTRRRRPSARARLAALAGLVLACASAPCLAAPKAPAPPVAAKKPATPPPAAPGASLLPGTGSKEPVNIAADKLDYFDRDQKLIYTGNVVAVQGDSTLKATVLTIFLEKQTPPAGTPAQPAPAQPGIAAPTSGSSVKFMDAKGPVTLISKDQVGTGDNGTYDKAANLVTLTGNVTLSQGTNVTQGDKLVYNLGSGQAHVFAGATNGRVISVFTPGSGAPGVDTGSPKATSKKDKAAAPAKKGMPSEASAAAER